MFLFISTNFAKLIYVKMIKSLVIILNEVMNQFLIKIKFCVNTRNKFGEQKILLTQNKEDC